MGIYIRKTSKEERAAYAREWRANNKEKLKIINQRWWSNNKEFRQKQKELRNE